MTNEWTLTNWQRGFLWSQKSPSNTEWVRNVSTIILHYFATKDFNQSMACVAGSLTFTDNLEHIKV